MQMHFKEKDIEDLIWDCIKAGTISNRGLYMRRGIIYRQIQIPGCGIPDLASISVQKITNDKQKAQKIIQVFIYELKRGEVTCEHVGQLCRYMSAVRSMMNDLHSHFSIPSDYFIVVDGVLIGESFQKDAMHIVRDLGNITPYSFGLDLKEGIWFKEVPWSDGIREYGPPDIKDSFMSICRASHPFKLNFSAQIGDMSPGEGRSDNGEAFPF